MTRTKDALSNVLPARARLGEGPLWDQERQLLYWVDIYNHRVHQFNPTTGTDQGFDVGEVVGAIAHTRDQRLLLAQRHRLALLDLTDGRVTPVLHLETDKPDNRFNDGKCDPQGRFWFGSMSATPQQANLYRYDPDGSLTILETGLTISNGLGWSPDQRTFYLTDSHLKVIYAYTYEADRGQIGDRRVLIDLSAESFSPDGLTVDATGCLWSAMWDGWCVIRFDPKGQEMQRFLLPVQRPTCCTFGNSDLSALYITTASVGLSETEIQHSFESGDLFCLPTEVQGLPAHPFGL